MLCFSFSAFAYHSNILEFEPGRSVLGSTVKEMNEALLARFNSRVKPSDTVIILGDVVLGSSAEKKDFISRLNGKLKVCVLGNHDDKASQMIKYGFDWACYQMMVRIAGQMVLLSHYPYEYSWLKWALGGFKADGKRIAGKRPKDNGGWLLHGHIHSGGHRGASWRVHKRQINVGVDVRNYYPISESEIANIIQRDKHD